MRRAAAGRQRDEHSGGGDGEYEPSRYVPHVVFPVALGLGSANHTERWRVSLNATSGWVTVVVDKMFDCMQSLSDRIATLIDKASLDRKAAIGGVE